MGRTDVLHDFSSDIKFAGDDARYRSSDPAKRTADWDKLPRDGYGKDGVKLAIRSVLDSGPTLTLNLYLYPDEAYFLSDLDVVNPAGKAVEVLEPVAASNLDIGAGADKRVLTTPYTNNFDFGVAPVNDFGSSQNGADRYEGEQLKWEPFNGISYWVSRCSTIPESRASSPAPRP